MAEFDWVNNLGKGLRFAEGLGQDLAKEFAKTQHDPIRQIGLQHKLIKIALDKGDNDSFTTLVGKTNLNLYSFHKEIIGYASKKGNIFAFSMLLEQEGLYDQEVKDELLLNEVKKGHEEFAKALISHGASLEKKHGWFFKESPIDFELGKKLQNAMLSKDINLDNLSAEAVEEAISQGKIKFNSHDSQGKPVVIKMIERAAADKNFEHIVKDLVTAGADLKEEFQGESAIHKAVKLHLDKVIEILYNKDNSILNLHDHTTHNYAPIHLAAMDKTSTSTLTYILSHGGNINELDHDGCSALMLAVKEHNMIAVKEILAHNPQIDLVDNQRHTALDYAHGDTEITKALLGANAHYGAEITKH